MAAPSPSTGESTVSFQIKSNGSAIPDTYQVLSVDINQQVNEVSTCTLTMLDGDAAREDFPVSDSDVLIPGAAIEVQIGYDNELRTVFKGIAISQRLVVHEGSGPSLKVVCKDEAIKMTVGRKNAAFSDTTDSQVISSIIGQYSGLSAAVDSTAVRLENINQYYASDWDFIVSRAELNSLVVNTLNGKVAVQNPNKKNSPVLTLTYGENIFSFNAAMDATHQYARAKSNAWDLDSEAVISAQANMDNIDQGNLSNTQLAEVIGLKDYELQTAAGLASAELDAWAAAEITRSRFAKIRGNMSFQGSALVTPGSWVTIEGMGQRFNGDAYVSGVRHQVSNGNWITSVEMGLSPEWYASKVQMQAPLASGLLPGIQGLQNGIVKQVHDDPDNEFRVLIEIPFLNDGGKGIWARLSNLYATKEAGAFFYPEVGDEVIVGFLNDDPNFPVILGALYNGDKKQAPIQPDEENSTKALITKSGNKLVFNDRDKETTLCTPGDNKLVLSDKDKVVTIADENGNMIRMSSSGIEIKSATSITLTADESISLSGQTGASVNADGGTVKLSGLDVSVNADTQLSMEGGATASLQGGGELTLKGAMVMIN